MDTHIETPAETNAINNLINEQRPGTRLSHVNMITSLGVIVGLEHVKSPLSCKSILDFLDRLPFLLG